MFKLLFDVFKKGARKSIRIVSAKQRQSIQSRAQAHQPLNPLYASDIYKKHILLDASNELKTKTIKYGDISILNKFSTLEIQFNQPEWHSTKLHQKIWQRWDSNPRPFGLVPKTSALDRSATLPRRIPRQFWLIINTQARGTAECDQQLNSWSLGPLTRLIAPKTYSLGSQLPFPPY
jgi:hypothetical protein